MKVISFFNNKGGVGKTTLTANLAAHFSQSLNHRVLVVDLDPQCNATTLILGTNKVVGIYWNGDSETRTGPTIRSVTAPLEAGDPEPAKTSVVWGSDSNRFSTSMIPGHPRLSFVEDILSQAWSAAIGGDLGGLRKTNWLHLYLSEFESQYDYVFLDLGPSLGALNRTALLASDFFVTPMGADIFSMLGLRNIADWLANWASAYIRGVEICKDRFTSYSDYRISPTATVSSGYAGYTVQAYIATQKGRPTKAYEQIIRDFPTSVEQNLGRYFARNVDVQSARLGEIPHMFSLVPLAQSASSPIRNLRSSDGLRGSHYSQAESYSRIIDMVAHNLEKNVQPVQAAEDGEARS